MKTHTYKTHCLVLLCAPSIGYNSPNVVSMFEIFADPTWELGAMVTCNWTDSTQMPVYGNNLSPSFEFNDGLILSSDRGTVSFLKKDKKRRDGRESGRGTKRMDFDELVGWVWGSTIPRAPAFLSVSPLPYPSAILSWRSPSPIVYDSTFQSGEVDLCLELEDPYFWRIAELTDDDMKEIFGANLGPEGGVLEELREVIMRMEDILVDSTYSEGSAVLCFLFLCLLLLPLLFPLLILPPSHLPPQPLIPPQSPLPPPLFHHLLPPTPLPPLSLLLSPLLPPPPLLPLSPPPLPSPLPGHFLILPWKFSPLILTNLGVRATIFPYTFSLICVVVVGVCCCGIFVVFVIFPFIH